MQYAEPRTPWTSCPDGYVLDDGWQRGKKRHRGHKPSYFFIWPKDGKRGTRWGRCKDILSGEGPDIHLAISGNGKLDYSNVPSRSRWSRWSELDPWAQYEDYSLPAAPWARRNPCDRYDFRKRRFCDPDYRTWTDVRWPPGANHHDHLPNAFRTLENEWVHLNRPRFAGAQNLAG